MISARRISRFPPLSRECAIVIKKWLRMCLYAFIPSDACKRVLCCLRTTRELIIIWLRILVFPLEFIHSIAQRNCLAAPRVYSRFISSSHACTLWECAYTLGHLQHGVVFFATRFRKDDDTWYRDMQTEFYSAAFKGWELYLYIQELLIFILLLLWFYLFSQIIELQKNSI